MTEDRSSAEHNGCEGVSAGRDAAEPSGVTVQSNYKPGNVAPDGSYLVGKCRPPQAGKFRKGDGRRRGRRKKGARNFATLLKAELKAGMTLVENGETKKVSKMQGIIKRHLDNALRGQNSAIQLFYTHALALLEAEAARGTGGVSQDDLAIVEQFIERRLQAQLSDPEPNEAPDNGS